MKYLQLTAWDVLNSSEGFLPLVNDAQLVDPIGELHAPDYGPCGLKKCKQPQKHSLLVSLLGGGFTNIGFDCGAKHFPDRWAELKRRSNTYRKQADEVASLEALAERLPQLEAEFQLARGKAKRVLNAMSLFRTNMPLAIIAELTRRAKNGETNIIRRDYVNRGFLFEDGHGQPSHANRVVGTLKGLHAFRADGDVCALFSLVERNIERIKNSLLAKPLGTNALVALRKKIARDADYLPATLRKAETAASAAALFFEQNNLDFLPLLDTAVNAGLKRVFIAADGTVAVQLK